MNFRVGQRVVCVDASPRRFPSSPLVIGEIYTITGIFPNFPSVTVAEARGLNCRGDFWADRFRPLVERKTDTGMAILKSILADAENYKVRETV